MSMVELVGWLGAGLLAICSFPQTLKNIREGTARSLSPYFIWLWFFGEILTLIYVIVDKFSWPLFTNYALNLTFSIILLKLYYLPKKVKHEANKEG